MKDSNWDKSSNWFLTRRTFSYHTTNRRDDILPLYPSSWRCLCSLQHPHQSRRRKSSAPTEQGRRILASLLKNQPRSFTPLPAFRGSRRRDASPTIMRMQAPTSSPPNSSPTSYESYMYSSAATNND